MRIKIMLGIALCMAGTACASITSVGSQAIAVGDSTAPTTLDLDQDGQADFSLYAYKTTISTYTLDYIQVKSLAPLASVIQADNIASMWNGSSSQALQVGNGGYSGFCVRFFIDDSVQVGWVKVDSVGGKLQVQSWAYQPGSDGIIAFGSTTDKLSTGPAIIRLQDFALISATDYQAKVGVQLLEKETLCYFVSTSSTAVKDTATFNKYPHACEAMEPGLMYALNTQNIQTFNEGNKYYVHYYAMDEAGNMTSPWMSEAMGVDLKTPTAVQFEVANQGPSRQGSAKVKFDEIGYLYFAVYETAASAQLSADSVVKGLGAKASGRLYQYNTTEARTFEFSGLPEGPYVVAVVAEDLVGNRSSLYTKYLEIDTTAPTISSLHLTANNSLVGVPSEGGSLYLIVREASSDQNLINPVKVAVDSGSWFLQYPCHLSGGRNCTDGEDYIVDVFMADNSGDASYKFEDDNQSPVYSLPFTYDANSSEGPDTLFMKIEPTGTGLNVVFSVDEYNVYASIAIVPQTGAIAGSVGAYQDMVRDMALVPDTLLNISANLEQNWEKLDGLKSETSYVLYMALHNTSSSPAGERLIAIPFSTKDITAPVLSAPQISAITEEGAQLTLGSNEEGFLYYKVQPANIMIPNALAIVNTGKKVSAGTPSSPVAETLSGLSAGTAYKVYAVAKDKAGNYSDIAETAFSTLAASSSGGNTSEPGTSSSSGGSTSEPGTSSSSSGSTSEPGTSNSSDNGNAGSSSGNSTIALTGVNENLQPIAYEVLAPSGIRLQTGTLLPGQDVRSIKGLPSGRYIVRLHRGSTRESLRLDVTR